ncbi:very short patch repair endonuclease [Bradyrhizobium sp.]|uniref:very short patch repair endonuclease n=1 Tax=Bradyrhizobium sp. TaxID=376 RepID=UPI00352C00CF
MSGIRGKNTKPELILRKLLHARGFRYRLHAKLPGKPDLVFPKHKAVLFVHGCFWHRHECSIFRWPGTRVEFWRTKINANFERDQRNVQKLLGHGWRVGVVWECATRDRKRLHTIANKCGAWLNSNQDQLEIE